MSFTSFTVQTLDGPRWINADQISSVGPYPTHDAPPPKVETMIFMVGRPQPIFCIEPYTQVTRRLRELE